MRSEFPGRIAGLFVGIASFAVLAADWGSVRSAGGMKSVDVSSPGNKLELTWRSVIVPGDDLLFVKSQLGTEVSYNRYAFQGIAGGSLQVKSSGAQQRTGEARDDPSFSQVLYVEPSADGSFYFVPPSLRGEGRVRVSRIPTNPGHYAVAVERSSP